ncbi:MAG: FAD-dependent oxidoreductase [cyanobacterium endosymbiont of Epithemia adnata isolate EadnSB Bon19]
MANRSICLQPVVINLGRDARMAATLYSDTLYIKLNCQPRNVFVREIQETLLTDFFAPPGMIP